MNHLKLILIVSGLAAAMFAKAIFLPSHVVFSNDCNYGLLVRGFRQWPMFHIWNDLNFIDHSEPGIVPNITGLLQFTLPAYVFAKAYAPLALVVTSVLVWFGLRLRGCSERGSFYGALLAVFNPMSFAVLCWGLATHMIAFGFAVLTVGFISSSVKRRAVFAGLCLGQCVTQSWDIGALYSIVIGCFALTKLKPREILTLVGLSLVVASPSIYQVLSSRAVNLGAPLTFEQAAAFAIHPEQVPGMFIPFAESYNPVGTVNFGLAIIALCFMSRKFSGWMALAVFAVLLSLGSYTPLFEMFYSLPFANLMRAPYKFLHLVQFSLLFIAVANIDRIKPSWILLPLLAFQIAYCSRWVKTEDISRYENPNEIIKFLAEKKKRVAFLPTGDNPQRAFAQYYDWLQKDFQYHGIPAYEVIQERQASPERLAIEARYPNLLERYKACGVHYLIDGNLQVIQITPTGDLLHREKP